MTDPETFEVIRAALLRFDPETRAEVIEAMRVMQKVPPQVAVRVLAHAAMEAAIRPKTLSVATCI